MSFFKTLPILLLGTFIAYIGGTLVATNDQLVKAQGQYLTQKVCGNAHGETDGPSEQACGDLQDKYNTKFICDTLPPRVHCWTEVL